MSFIEATPPRVPHPSRSAWRWFPWFVTGAMTIVVVVNFGMGWAALHTFPGIAGRDGFDLSNHYDRVLDVVAREAALGWKIDAATDADGMPVVVLTDRTGSALQSVRLVAEAERPLGPDKETPLTFKAVGPGRYVATASLPEKGQWDLLLTVTAEGHSVSTTRRVIVK